MLLKWQKCNLSTLNNLNNLKVYSFLSESGAFRLTNGQIKEFKSPSIDNQNRKGLAIIGSNHFNWDGSIDGIRAVLKLIRPIPQILVLASPKLPDESLKSELKNDFGCSVEAFVDKMAAATTFNALIDDNRLTIGFFS